MNVNGACHCGNIRFTAVVDPQDVCICHCTDCQTLTATAFRVSVPSRAEDVTFIRGEPRIYTKFGENGAPRVQAFCADCGSPLYSTAGTENPSEYGLRVGILEQRDLLPPKQEIWCRSALPWVQPIEGTVRFEKDD